MDIKQIDEIMEAYVNNQEMAGGALFVRQGVPPEMGRGGV